MKAKNIATLVEDLTAFCPTRFKEYIHVYIFIFKECSIDISIHSVDM